MPDVADLPEISRLTQKLSEALVQLNDARVDMDQHTKMANEKTDRYRQLFDLVSALQKEIHEAISVCLNVQRYK